MCNLAYQKYNFEIGISQVKEIQVRIITAEGKELTKRSWHSLGGH